MKKILLQDYLASLFGEYRGVLSRPGIAAYTAGTAEEALDIHREKKADLVIVDLDMPVMGGDRLCFEIRKDKDQKPYIVLVCSERKADLQRCDSCGANSYLSKPPGSAALYGAVCRALDIPERKGMRVLIKVTVHGRFKKEPFYCTSRDVSVSGILLETEKVLAKGDEITCSFFLPDTDRIDARGEVVRVASSGQSYNYGVQFVDLPQDSAAAIDVFIDRAKSTPVGW